MECRPLDITILSAKDLKNVNFITKMDVYVVVSIEGGDPRMTQRSPVDKDAGKNPQWNFLMKFTLEEAAVASNHLTLVFTIMSERALGDRVIGHVHVPLKELLDTSISSKNSSSGGTSGKTASYVVRTTKGKEKGSLDFLYRFGEKYNYAAAPPPPAAVAPPSVKAANEPVMAYPAATGAPGSSSSYTAYPPPGYVQPGYGYPPQQPGYGYPPQYPPQPGYGYPASQPVQKPQKKLGGAGLGLGLAGGLLGGLLIGDMISDVGDAAAYEAGYDAGFDDGFGF